jgi:hypothetical protein
MSSHLIASTCLHKLAPREKSGSHRRPPMGAESGVCLHGDDNIKPRRHERVETVHESLIVVSCGVSRR